MPRKRRGQRKTILERKGKERKKRIYGGMGVIKRRERLSMAVIVEEVKRER